MNSSQRFSTVLLQSGLGNPILHGQMKNVGIAPSAIYAWLYLLLHAPAAYISSLAQSCHLIAKIISRPPAPSIHLADTVSDLATAAEMPNWVSVDDIGVPLHRHSLSHRIDEASYNSFLASAPDTRSRALAFSTALPHARHWLNVVPSSALGLHHHDREFRLCVDYWLGLRMSDGASRCPLCLGVRANDPWATIKWDVGELKLHPQTRQP